MAKVSIKELAEIEYHGADGITPTCLEAIARIIHFGSRIHKAQLLSRINDGFGSHAFLLTMEYDDLIVIGSGFASGYSGEGPRGLSTAIKLLLKHSVDIEEYEISHQMMDRLKAGCLLIKDLDWLEQERPVRPIRYRDYILERHKEYLEKHFPASINFGLIAPNLMDLALVFFQNPSHAIDTAYKRLEDTLRQRTGLLDESGSKLFSKAFLGDDSLLHWDDVSSNEHNSKANLFKAIFGAYRNPRAHREIDTDEKASLREFMLINELYLLEASAIPREIETYE
ncbi:MAG: hypothetical protein OXE99_15205 [Cellvibrionales bacterium]|nr:hypothetical protein [Cellvibrionales bacterium]